MIRRLKSCVIQEEEYGCVIANIATVLGLSYKQVSKWFRVNFNKTGISTLDAANFLAGYGFDMNWCETRRYNDYIKQKERMLKPLADIHIVSVIQRIDSKTGHSLIMDGRGKIFCPYDGKEFTEDFLCVNGVLDIWYPKHFKLGRLAGLK